MGLIASTYFTVERFVPGQLITLSGSRNTPYMKTMNGYVNLVTLEETALERGETPVLARPLYKRDIMRKYRLSHVQFDGWEEYLNKHIKPRYIK